MEEILAFILFFISKYPVFASILVVIGALRLINKPLFAIIRSVAEYTESPKDDELLNKVEGSKIYRGICFVLDYLGSIKLPKKQ